MSQKIDKKNIFFPLFVLFASAYLMFSYVPIVHLITFQSLTLFFCGIGLLIWSYLFGMPRASEELSKWNEKIIDNRKQ